MSAAESWALDALVCDAQKVDVAAGTAARGSPWAVANGAMDFSAGLSTLAATWAVGDPYLNLSVGVPAMMALTAATLVADRNRLLPPLTARRPLRDLWLGLISDEAAAVPGRDTLRFVLREKAAWTAARGFLAALPLVVCCSALAVFGARVDDMRLVVIGSACAGINICNLLQDLRWLALFAVARPTDALATANDAAVASSMAPRDARARLLGALLARDFERERAGGTASAPLLLQPLSFMPVEWYVLARSARRESAVERVWLLARGRAMLQRWMAVEQVARDGADRDMAAALASATTNDTAEPIAPTLQQTPREWLAAEGAGDTFTFDRGVCKTCAICLGRSEEEEDGGGGEPPLWTAFPCAAKHEFHEECLCTYLVRAAHRVCPCCRSGPTRGSGGADENSSHSLTAD